MFIKSANQQLQAIGWMILHSFLFTLIAVLTRFLLADLSIAMLYFLHSFIAAILLTPFAIMRRAQFKRAKFHWHIARGVMATLSMVIYFYVLTLLPLADITAFSLIGPLIVSLFALIFFKEHISRYQLIALFLGITGALFIIRPGFQSFNVAFIYMLAVLLLWATISMVLKILARTESTFIQLYWLNVISSIVILPFVIADWHLPDSMTAWFLLLTLTLLYIFNGMAIYNAFRLGKVAVIMPFVYIQVVLAALYGYMLFDEALNIYTALGAAIIVIGNVYSVRKTSSSKHWCTIRHRSE